jgi:OHCU decarboxylase
MIALDALNGMPAADFAAALGTVFEHSPWVAERAAAERPFASRLDLLDGMRAVVARAAPAEQLGLIRAHPQLGARGRSRTQLTVASAREQRRAGLDACSDQEFATLMELNRDYVAKFDFPFILAVRGHEPRSILATIARRIGNEPAVERHTALGEIGAIAGYRLADLVATAPGSEIMAMQTRLAACAAGAAGEAGAAALLMREWMLAAGLDVPVCADGDVVGVQRSVPQAAQLLLGAHIDALNQRLCCDGRLGVLTAIAVVQDLRHQAAQLPFELILLARAGEAGMGSVLLHADPDAIRGCAAPGAAELDALPALRAAGVGDACLAIVRQGPAGIAYRTDAAVDVATLQRAARALEDFLLQTQPHGLATPGRKADVALHG